MGRKRGRERHGEEKRNRISASDEDRAKCERKHISESGNAPKPKQKNEDEENERTRKRKRYREGGEGYNCSQGRPCADAQGWRHHGRHQRRAGSRCRGGRRCCRHGS